jgi:hypothetical protein
LNSLAISDQYVNLSEPTLTYTWDLLTRIDYPNGKYKVFAYNVDDTLASIDYNNEYTKTFTYSWWKLTQIST